MPSPLLQCTSGLPQLRKLSVSYMDNGITAGALAGLEHLTWLKWVPKSQGSYLEGSRITYSQVSWLTLGPICSIYT